MEEIQEPRFFCKFCNKACSTGKSLGGHMRGHLGLIAAAKKQKLKSEASGKKDFSLYSEPISAKSQSSAKNVDSQSKNNLCEKCGKAFSSVKALAGHLKVHSRKYSQEDEGDDDNEEHHICKKCGREFGSIRAMYGHMKIHAKRSNEVQSLSDLDAMCPVRKKRSSIRYNKPTISDLDEVNDAAMSLLMLSMGVCTWNGFVSAKESLCCHEDVDDDSEKSAADNEDDDDDSEKSAADNEDDDDDSEKSAADNEEDDDDPEKSAADNEEMNIVSETVIEAVISKFPKDYACPICFKVFQSGQALGGHKRAHYIANIAEEVVEERENLSDIHGILDLNLLPVNGVAMEEERVWLHGMDKQLMMMISN